MTLNQFLRIGLRRWYIVVFCAVLTVVGVFVATRPNPVYWTRVSVVFLAPTSLDNPNSLGATTESLISFAAIVDREYNGNVQTPRFSSLEATLYGAGARSAARVELLNTGGQWNNAFTRPELTVEVVDDSEQAVRSTLAEITSRIDGIVAQQQDAAGVPDADRISTLTSPQSAVVSSAQGNRLRAAGSVLLLGVGGCVVATVLIDRRLLRHARTGADKRPAAVEETVAFH